jgi:hypothetical protein
MVFSIAATLVMVASMFSPEIPAEAARSYAFSSFSVVGR